MVYTMNTYIYFIILKNVLYSQSDNEKLLGEKKLDWSTGSGSCIFSVSPLVKWVSSASAFRLVSYSHGF
jgi:hypothetical protein